MANKGRSEPDVFGGDCNSDGQGCHVATCVYGSYDLPAGLERCGDSETGRLPKTRSDGRLFAHIMRSARRSSNTLAKRRGFKPCGAAASRSRREG